MCKVAVVYFIGVLLFNCVVLVVLFFGGIIVKYFLICLGLVFIELGRIWFVEFFFKLYLCCWIFWVILILVDIDEKLFLLLLKIVILFLNIVLIVLFSLGCICFFLGCFVFKVVKSFFVDWKWFFIEIFSIFFKIFLNILLILIWEC